MENEFTEDDAILTQLESILPTSLSNQSPEECFVGPYSAEDEHNYSGPVTADSEEVCIPPTKVRKLTRKVLRNSGQEYVSTSGKIVPKRQPRELENCRNKCKERISNEKQQQIFDEYWALGSYLARQTFVSNLIEILETKTIRKQKSLTNPRNRQYAYKYFFSVGAERVNVCQKCFLSTLAESEQFLKTLIKKKQEANGDFTGSDKRGKHTKKSAQKQQKLIQIISEFASVSNSDDNNTPNSTNKLQISKSYKIKFEKIGDLEVLTRKRVYNKESPCKKKS